MNFDLTRSSLLSTVLYTVLLVALFWWGGSISGVVANGNTAMWGERWEPLGSLYDSAPIVCRMLSAVVVFICSLLVARISIRNVIFLERTYMPSVIFVLVSSAFYNIEHSLAPLLASWLIMLSMSLTLRSYTLKRLATGVFFVAGVYLGGAALLFPPTAYVGVMLLFGIAMFRIGDLREWVAVVVGALFPLSVYVYVTWLIGGDVMHKLSLYGDALTLSDGTTKQILHLNIVEQTFGITICVLLLLSLARFIKKRESYKLRSALCFGFFTMLLFSSVAIMVISPVRTLYFMPIIAFPIAVLIPTYFASGKPTFLSNFLYAMLLLSAIAIHLLR